MIRKTLILALGLVALMAAPAAAQYGSATGSASTDGETITVIGEGFAANATVDYSVEYDGSVVETGETTSDAEGDVQFTVDVRGDGVYNITMTDGTTSVVASTTVGAAAAPAPAPADSGALPRTGDDTSSTLAQVGFAAVALGAVAVYGAQRRKAKAFA